MVFLSSWYEFSYLETQTDFTADWSVKVRTKLSTDISVLRISRLQFLRTYFGFLYTVEAFAIYHLENFKKILLLETVVYETELA